MRLSRLFPFAFVVALWACSDETSPGARPCALDGDCPDGQVCHGGICRGECATSNDCSGDQMCVSGACLETCQTDGDCPDGQACQNGFCVSDQPVDGGVDAGGGDDGGGPADSGADGDQSDAASDAETDGGNDAGPDASDPGPSCPSGVWCGSPAECCLAAEECYQGACVPVCDSGIRCGEDGLTCCPAGDVCLARECVTPSEPCSDSFDCPVGYFCEPTIGQCLPQIIEDVCEYLPEFEEFEPLVEWHWEGYSQDMDIHNVAVTPAVADIDADGIPEVAFAAYAAGAESSAILVVVSGLDGTEELVIPSGTMRLTRWSGVALGNLDADPELEMVVVVQGLGIAALEHDGTVKWDTASGSLSSFSGNNRYGFASIANLDADPFPEVVMGAVALDDADGAVIFDEGLIGCNGDWCMSAVADLDMNGEPDIVGGNRAYTATGAVLWHQPGVSDGFPAVADLDQDGAPDVVTVSSGQVWVLRGLDGEILFGPVDIPGGGNGGAPTVADFDGDGRAEFSTAGQGYYAVYDLDCREPVDPALCPSERDDGILWAVVTQDISSSITGSSVFDFEGDGRAEVVYNDECHLYILAGLTGETLLYMANSSRTAAEYPLVVDVDGDNNSEFLVPANNDKIERDHCDPPGQVGVKAFGDSHDRWMRTRRVWNQHSYHVTNVLPGGQVPETESNNWEVEGLNNFRQNVQGEGVYNAPDLVIAGLEVEMGPGCESLQIRAHVANHGALGVYPGVPVAFYLGVPYSGELLGVKTTSIPLLPGQSEILTLEYVFPPGDQGPWDFYVTADDDGQGQGSHSECIEDNNTATITEAECFR